MIPDEGLLQFAHIAEGFSGDQLAGGVNRFVILRIPPHTHGVEVLKGQPDWIHAVMAGRTKSISQMCCQGFSQRGGAIGQALRGIFKGGDVWRRWRWWRP